MEPYEELLRDVRCPDYLIQQLSKAWLLDDHNSSVDDPYFVIRQVVESLQEDPELLDQSEIEQQLEARNVLFHTLYRYLVLLAGAPTFISGLVDNELYENNRVWKVLNDCLELRKFNISKKSNISRSNKHGNQKQECLREFEKHVKTWSIVSGDHAVMKNVKNNLASLGQGASDLLFSLLHWDPSQRLVDLASFSLHCFNIDSNFFIF